MNLELGVELVVVGEHVSDVGDGGRHAAPHDVFCLVLQVHGEIEGVPIIYDVGPERLKETESVLCLSDQQMNAQMCLCAIFLPRESKNVIDVACSVGHIKLLLEKTWDIGVHQLKSYK